jgi:hypothetical protein
MKQSNDQYRNLCGKRYECIEHNAEWFEALKAQCKAEGRNYRIIDGQFYRAALADEAGGKA